MSARKGVPQHHPNPPPLERWIDHANCAGHDATKFFDPKRFAEALLVCRGCPVQAPCAKQGAGVEGVWGNKIHYSPRGRR